jgi:hypothetical protein
MSSVASPYGLRPAQHPSGCIRQREGTIASGYNTAIFQNSPVAIIADGSLAVAAAGAAAIGVFMGVEWTGQDGRRRVGNQWIADTVGSDIVAYYTSDQDIIYEIQANATLTRAAMGEQFDWAALSGNTVTGLSSVPLDVASSAANAGLRVVGLNPAPDNDWGDAFPILQVQISEHQFVANVAAI